ncbi:MAG: phosphoserine aminotransferase [Spirosomataceae bacterium]|jgi:phosphoserine aminotransferase
MHNFYPGPSKLYPYVKHWLSEIYDSGILSKNHRSDAFMQLWADTDSKLRDSLSIPDGYEIYVTSSATECWKIVNQSLVYGNTTFVSNGAFGKKWANYAIKNNSLSNRKGVKITESEFDVNAEPPTEFQTEPDTICLTHNETSNGTYLPDEYLIKIRKQYPKTFIALDATSSMAGVSLPWQTGDVWFASVQKCFGLPSGLAILVVSPKAVERAETVNDGVFYNSFLNIRANFLKNQTPYTPNILGIALLNKQAGFVGNNEIIDEKIKSRAANFYQFIKTQTAFDPLIETEKVQSPTVITIRSKETDVLNVIEEMKAKGITLGKGYGEWKNDTFRVANFPAITDSEFEYLMKALN